MSNADNENEPLPFQSLAAITTRLLESSRTRNEKRPTDSAGDQGDEQRNERQREYVKQRLRELSGFERRARGDKKPRETMLERFMSPLDAGALGENLDVGEKRAIMSPRPLSRRS